MHYEVGKTYAWAFQYGTGYAAQYAFPGNKRTRYMLDPKGKVLVFPSFKDAIEAALTLVKKREPDIRASLAADDTAVVPSFLDPKLWKADRARRRAVETREAFKGLGKGFLQVETRRRRGA